MDYAMDIGGKVKRFMQIYKKSILREMSQHVVFYQYVQVPSYTAVMKMQMKHKIQFYYQPLFRKKLLKT